MLTMRHIKIAFIIVISVAVSGIVGIGGYALMRGLQFPPRVSYSIPLRTNYEADSVTGFRNKGNLDTLRPFGNGAMFPIRTDPRGIRVPEDAKEPVKSAQIMLIGDSQTFGQGLRFKETLSGQLHARTGMQVANLGVIGFSALSALKQAKKFADLRPQWLVMVYNFDHADRSLSPCHPGYNLGCISVPYFDVSVDPPVIVPPEENAELLEDIDSYFKYAQGLDGTHTIWRDSWWRGRQEMAKFLRNIGWMRSFRKHSDPARTTVARWLVNRLRELAEELSARPVIVYIPNYFQKIIVPPLREIREVAKENRIPFVDMTTAFQDLRNLDSDRLIIRSDGHLTAEANSLMADALVRVLGLR